MINTILTNTIDSLINRDKNKIFEDLREQLLSKFDKDEISKYKKMDDLLDLETGEIHFYDGNLKYKVTYGDDFFFNEVDNKVLDYCRKTLELLQQRNPKYINKLITTNECEDLEELFRLIVGNELIYEYREIKNYEIYEEFQDIKI